MFPGELKELRDIKNPTVLFCGAGLSIGAVPGASGLYEDEHNKVEHYLGIDKSNEHATRWKGRSVTHIVIIFYINYHCCPVNSLPLRRRGLIGRMADRSGF